MKYESFWLKGMISLLIEYLKTIRHNQKIVIDYISKIGYNNEIVKNLNAMKRRVVKWTFYKRANMCWKLVFVNFMKMVLEHILWAKVIWLGEYGSNRYIARWW